MEPSELEAMMREELSYYLGLHNLRIYDDLGSQEPVDDLIRTLRGQVATFLTNSAKAKGVQVFAEFVDSNRVGGRAVLRRSGDLEFRFATVRSGSAYCFHELYCYLLSRFDVLPSIGISTRERNLPYRFRPQLTYPATKELRDRGLLLNSLPLDSTRLAFGQHLSAIATAFLILHEIGHCVHGHLTSELSFSETAGRSKESRADTIRRHTCEMDADSFALTNTFRQPFLSMREAMERDNSITFQEAFRIFAYPAVLAILILFRYQGESVQLPEDHTAFFEGSHPPPLVRSYYLTVNILTFAQSKGWSTTDLSLLSANVVAAQFDADALWSGLVGLPGSNPALLGFRWQNGVNKETLGTAMGEIWAYVTELLVCWQQIRPELQARALETLAP